MTTLLRGLLVGSAVALAAGLVMHFAGSGYGDRVITAGLLVLAAIPVVNTLVAVADELQRLRDSNNQ